MKRSVLGRGLEALISQDLKESVSETERVMDLEIGRPYILSAEREVGLAGAAADGGKLVIEHQHLHALTASPCFCATT